MRFNPLAIGIGIGVLIVCSAVGKFYWGTENIQVSNARAVKAVVDANGPETKILGSRCTGNDSSGDGFLTCQVKYSVLLPGSTQPVLQSDDLSCPTRWTAIFNGGQCKTKNEVTFSNPRR